MCVVTGREQRAIRPFRSRSRRSLDDLRRASRHALARKGARRGSSQGVQLATMQALARYWATDYDWRKCEAS